MCPALPPLCGSCPLPCADGIGKQGEPNQLQAAVMEAERLNNIDRSLVRDVNFYWEAKP